MNWVTWSAIKLFAKKAWVWLKHHWKIVALIVWTIVIWAVSRKNAKAMLKVLDAARQSYEDEIDVLNKTHEEELKKRTQAISKYQELISSIEEQYEEQKDQLTFEKRARIKELIDSFHDDQEALNNALKEEFGFEHVQ